MADRKSGEDEGAWFAPKRFGYGAGLPIAWQGWAVLAAYLVAVLGIAVLTPPLGTGPFVAGEATILVLTVVLIGVCAKRTRGGWRWRWGDQD